MRHPVGMEAYAREYRRDILREAERRRLVRLAQADRPGLAERLSGRVSGLLAAARERLQEQRIPSPTPQTGRPLEGLE
jgi:hypothetical protein